MQNQLLTRDEVAELTGVKTKTGQRQVLARNHINHIVRKDGWPMVTWHHVNNPQTIEVTVDTANQPNFAALIGSDVYA